VVLIPEQHEITTAVVAELARRNIAASRMAKELSVSRQSASLWLSGRAHIGPKTEKRLKEWLEKSQAGAFDHHENGNTE